VVGWKDMRRLIRAAVLAAHMLLGVVLALGVLLLPNSLRQRAVPKLSGWWLRRGAGIIGIRVLVHGAPSESSCLRLANHISWLDILVLATQSDAAFVAKAEVGAWPLIGWLARVGNTEFVARRELSSVNRVIKRLTARLAAGESVIVFPEATSHGNVLPARFRPRIMQAAVDAGAHVQPVAIYYGAAPEVMERVAFVGEDTFLSHLWRVLGGGPVLAEVTYLPPLATVTGDCRLLADEAWRAVSHILSQLELYELEAQHGRLQAVEFITRAA
jgi:1-acyl-sn-glycerol-3-phosphate acyltransferase